MGDVAANYVLRENNRIYCIQTAVTYQQYGIKTQQALIDTQESVWMQVRTDLTLILHRGSYHHIFIHNPLHRYYIILKISGDNSPPTYIKDLSIPYSTRRIPCFGVMWKFILHTIEYYYYSYYNMQVTRLQVQNLFPFYNNRTMYRHYLFLWRQWVI